MTKLVLVRHGQSQWNKENRFTGWTDIDLSPEGEQEARRAGDILFKNGFHFDVGYSSVLKRAIRTLEIIAERMNLRGLIVKKSYALNERFYGALQGLNKTETAEKYGAQQVRLWRRGYKIKPPAVDEADPRYPGNDALYAGVKNLPTAESLEDTLARVTQYFHSEILRDIAGGRRVVISAHGNSLRALVKELDGISDDEIMTLEIPTGAPLVYEFDDNLKPVRRYYL